MITLFLSTLAWAGGIGSQVYVVERATESVAIYDWMDQKVLGRLEGFGNMRHAVVTFSPDLQWGYVATRSGLLTRINLQEMSLAGEVRTSRNSIDIAIRQDGKLIAVAEYAPGGLSLLDAQTLELVHRFDSPTSRVTGVVDAPGNRFIAVTIETGEVWIIEDSKEPTITHRIPTVAKNPYDAMISADGRYYLVGHLDSDLVSVVDLDHPEAGARAVSLLEKTDQTRENPVKLPHMASWAVAGDRVFVPLVGRSQMAILDRSTFERKATIDVEGHPVYAVADPYGRKVWVSFSGEEHDHKVQVVDAETLQTDRVLALGGRIYHMDFTPRGGHVLVSANRDNLLFLVEAATGEVVDRQELESPSGVFGPWRAFRPGL